MLYLYDNAICDDLRRSLNPDNVPNPVVSVLDGEGVLKVAAQLQNDEIQFPIICVMRDEDTPIDETRMNFTRAHRGVATVIDPKTNNLYYEKALPIKLGYTFCIYTTNQADMDELVREMMFKYLDMYFLSIRLPYESNRKIRFGITVDAETEISKKSGSSEYMNGGTLYEADIHMNCQGCVLVQYTPAHLRRIEYDVEVE